MQVKLKIVGFSPIYQSHENEIWDAVLTDDPNYTIGNVHLLTVGNKNYSFDIKEARVAKHKLLLTGWLSSNEAMGRIAFEIQ